MSNFECQSCGTMLANGQEVLKHKREYGHQYYKHLEENAVVLEKKMDTTEFLKERVMNNVSRLLDEGYQDINIKLTRNGFNITPTKKRRILNGDLKEVEDE